MKIIKLIYPTLLIFTLLIGICIGFYIDLPREVTITVEYGDSVIQIMEKIDTLTEKQNNRTFIMSNNEVMPKPAKIVTTRTEIK